MNNSFARLIDGMNATLRSEVLSRLDDEFARGQVFGVINLLNTFKVRADWSTGFLLEQLAVQRTALDGVAALMQGWPACLHRCPSPSCSRSATAPTAPSASCSAGSTHSGPKAVSCPRRWPPTSNNCCAPPCAASSPSS